MLLLLLIFCRLPFVASIFGFWILDYQLYVNKARFLFELPACLPVCVCVQRSGPLCFTVTDMLRFGDRVKYYLLNINM